MALKFNNFSLKVNDVSSILINSFLKLSVLSLKFSLCISKSLVCSVNVILKSCISVLACFRFISDSIYIYFDSTLKISYISVMYISKCLKCSRSCSSFSLDSLIKLGFIISMCLLEGVNSSIKVLSCLLKISDKTSIFSYLLLELCVCFLKSSLSCINVSLKSYICSLEISLESSDRLLELEILIIESFLKTLNFFKKLLLLSCELIKNCLLLSCD